MKKTSLLALALFSVTMAFSQKTNKFNLDFIIKLQSLNGNEYKNHCKKIGLVVTTEWECCFPNSQYEELHKGFEDYFCIVDNRVDFNEIKINFQVSNESKNIPYKKNPYFENIINELKLRKYKSEKLYSSWFNVYVTKYYISPSLFIYTFRNADYMQLRLSNKDLSKSLNLVQ